MSKIIRTDYNLDLELGTLAFCSDLHECKQDGVLAILRDAHPDIILIAGDVFERKDEKHRKHVWNDEKYMFQFFEEAVHLAPVYMSLGNHEEYITDEDRKKIRDAGVNLLDDSYVELESKGKNRIFLGGVTSEVIHGQVDEEFLRKFEALPGKKLLLCHHPEYYERYLKDKKIDYIFSGHAHGGQFRIAGHGIFAPGQGFLPKYHHGIYDGRLIVSSGCANNTMIPRFGNPCEVVIINKNVP